MPSSWCSGRPSWIRRRPDSGAEEAIGPGRIEFGETHLFVGPRYVVSVRHGPSLAYTGVRQRCEATPNLLAKGPGFVLYALLDFVVDQYFPIVDALEDELDALEDGLFTATSRRETTARIYRLKRDLLEVKHAVSPLVEVCNRLPVMTWTWSRRIPASTSATSTTT